MEFISKTTVTLVDSMGRDHYVRAAANVSVNGEDALQYMQTPNDSKEVIRFLMRMRHGTPFEHNAFIFFVHAPIMVFREFHRHRIGFSYNEESGRYHPLKPVFWIPTRNRAMMRVDGWKAGKPKFLTIDEFMQQRFPDEPLTMIQEMSDALYNRMIQRRKRSYEIAYSDYLADMEEGVAFEVARDKLPVGIYSSMWVTCNARSLMNFLSLRTHEATAKYVSYPQLEIEGVARSMEEAFKELFPITHAAFNEYGRVGP